MKTKETIITILIVVFTCALLSINYFANRLILDADSVFQVYVNGTTLGYISNKDELYSLINKKQKEIKKKYNVSNVYPPENFEIVKVNTYNVEISPVNDIYNKIAKLESFTLDGFIITIKNDSDFKYINVLDRKIFDSAIHNFVLAFVSEEQYTNYINESQPQIDTTGKIIENMFFDETITIKKSFISVNDKIFTNESALSQYLLFGSDTILSNYVVESGDTIESISTNNKLNVQEFLVANPKYTSKDSLLTIGDKVNVTLINPILSFSYKVSEVLDTEIPYEKKVVYDDTKSGDFSEITTLGVTGVTRISENYIVKNGEVLQGVDITKQEKITEKVDEITTKGRYYSSPGIGQYVDTGTEWQWPTNRPYVITSYWAYRWGVFHDGIDISGTGYASPIYAALDGTVISAGWGGMLGSVSGVNVVIQHDNGYVTFYAHMVDGSLLVSTGDKVARGQRIGSMGSTGYSTGYHLHFGLSYGIPYAGGTPINPLSLWN